MFKIPHLFSLKFLLLLEKGTRTCAKIFHCKLHLIYAKWSNNHKAFTSRIDNLFVHWNIQEALDNSNWKLVVMEEMNALRQSGT